MAGACSDRLWLVDPPEGGRDLFSYRTDIWRPGILRAPIEACRGETWPPAEIVWLPEPGPYRFLADPFGSWRGDELHVFAEAYDYADKKGRIVCHRYDRQLRWLGGTLAMEAPHHLSYPFLLEEGDELYMVPEAHRSGALRLFRQRGGPDAWDEVAVLLDLPAIDASILRFEGRWWMFFALPGPEEAAQRMLHLAFADRLVGPWRLHPGNPVRQDRANARPAGTPVVFDGFVHLPVQDCRDGYGRAVQWLRFDRLTPAEAATTPLARMEAGQWSAPYAEGMHTLSACGPVTLFDVKRVDRSPRRALVNLKRRWRRLLGR